MQLTNKAGTTFSLLLTKVEKKHTDILARRLKTISLYTYCSLGIKKQNLYCIVYIYTFVLYWLCIVIFRIFGEETSFGNNNWLAPMPPLYMKCKNSSGWYYLKSKVSHLMLKDSIKLKHWRFSRYSPFYSLPYINNIYIILYIYYTICIIYYINVSFIILYICILYYTYIIIYTYIDR